MLKAYDFRGFPNPAQVRSAVAAKGIRDIVEFIAVDVPNGEHKQPNVMSKNPDAAVPVLEFEDGPCIAECAAIAEYPDHLSGEPILAGKTTKERAVVHMIQRRAEANLLDAAATYFHHARPGLGPKIEPYQNRQWGEKSRERVTSGMRYFDGLLARQPYLVSDNFTMVDIKGFAGMACFDFAEIEIPAELGNLRSWRDRLAERPSVKSA